MSENLILNKLKEHDVRFDAVDKRANGLQSEMNLLREEIHILGLKQEAHEHKTDLVLEIVQGISEKLDTINAHTAQLGNHEVRISALEHGYRSKL